MTTNLEKLRYHAEQAERYQVQIEEIEEAADAVAARQQYGRMSRSNNTVLPDTYMAKSLLKDNHEYTRLVGSRNGHQAMVAMYSALVQAGIRETNYVRHSGDGKNYRLTAISDHVAQGQSGSP